MWKRDGKVKVYCSECGEVQTSKKFYAVTSIQLSQKYFDYDGKAKKPTVKVLDSKGNTLKKGTDYTLRYSKGRKNIGKYSVSITFIGNYTGIKTLNFKIIPGKPTGLKAAAGKKLTKLTWNPVKGATHYYVYCSAAKDGTFKKALTVKGKSAATIKKLESGKKYYFRVRAVTRLDSGDKIQGYASAVKGAKIK